MHFETARLLALKICALEFLNIRPQSHLSLSNRGDSGQTSREMFTHLDRALIEQLDAAIDRKMFYDDFLETPTITRPLPDKVTQRHFDTDTDRHKTRI